MQAADWVVAVAVLVAPLALAVCSIVGDASLTWYATEPLRWPALRVAPALALVPLLAPLVLLRRGGAR
jgi:hypothetical protein